MKNITVEELNKKIKNKDNIHIIDIREKYEWDADHLVESKWIRMQEIPDKINEIPRNVQVIIICRSGRRSEAVCHFLTNECGFNDVWNLEGGLLSWKELINNKFDIE